MKAHSIYEFPAIFRAVQMEAPGEIEAEVGFLKQVWTRHLRRPVRHALDVACGNSPHGQLLAREGIEVVGIDRSPSMLAAGRREGPTVRFFKRPMDRFTLPCRALDAAFFMSETYPVMIENGDVTSHLRSVARVLRKGGIYCVDIDRHGGIEELKGRRPWRRRLVRVEGAEVTVREFRRPLSWLAGTWIYDLNCRIRFPDRTVITQDLVPVRYTIPKLLELEVKAAGCFDLIATYADLSFDVPMERCYRRWWGVLKRR